MKPTILLLITFALSFFLGCTPKDTIIDLEHKIKALERQVEIEEAMHRRLQAYIDNVLKEGGAEFSKGRDGRDPTRVYSLGIRDTVIKAIPDPKMDAFESILKEALEEMVSKGLKVNRIQNQIYLTVGEKLLFQSGETGLSSRGIANIQKIAKLISAQKELLVVVEGHTDNIPVVSIPGIKDNWDLSVLRATQVTRELIKGGVPAEYILAAGRGGLHPIVPNESEGKRYLNRRTEIILTPAFD